MVRSLETSAIPCLKFPSTASPASRSLRSSRSCSSKRVATAFKLRPSEASSSCESTGTRTPGSPWPSASADARSESRRWSRRRRTRWEPMVIGTSSEARTIHIWTSNPGVRLSKRKPATRSEAPTRTRKEPRSRPANVVTGTHYHQWPARSQARTRARSALGDLRGVADAGHRADQLGVLAELGAETADVHVDGSCLAEVAQPPHLVQELLPREDPSGPLEEVFEEP